MTLLRFIRIVLLTACASALACHAQVSNVMPLGTNNIVPLSTNSVRGVAMDIGFQKTVYAILSCNAVTNANFTGFGSNYVALEACADTNDNDTIISTNWFQPTTNYNIAFVLSNTNYVFTNGITLDTSSIRYLREKSWGNNGTNLVSTNLAISIWYKVQ